MRKYLIILPLLLAMSCSNEGIENNSDNWTGNPTNPDKSTETDEFLIDAIQGNNASYEDVSSLLDLLLDNAALSADVLTALVEEPRLDNSFVEMVLVASSPISSEGIDMIMNVRPGLDRNVLEAAQAVEPGSMFSVIGYPEMEMVFAGNLTRTPVITEDCPEGCSSELSAGEGENMLVIHLSVPATAPGYMVLGCNPNKWVCGDAYIEDPGPPIVVNCIQSNKKCMRLPKLADISITPL